VNSLLTTPWNEDSVSVALRVVPRGGLVAPTITRVKYGNAHVMFTMGDYFPYVNTRLVTVLR
jgi:hypothetical protein